MTKDAINVAIAEWRGWKLMEIESAAQSICAVPLPKRQVWALNGELTHSSPPNYFGDLNAISEAEWALNFNEQESTQLFEYRCALTKACGNDLDLIPFASAPQRCEALLRTLNLWKE